MTAQVAHCLRFETRLETAGLRTCKPRALFLAAWSIDNRHHIYHLEVADEKDRRDWCNGYAGPGGERRIESASRNNRGRRNARPVSRRQHGPSERRKAVPRNRQGGWR